MCSATFPTRCMPRLACIFKYEWGLGGPIFRVPTRSDLRNFAFETFILEGGFFLRGPRGGLDLLVRCGLEQSDCGPASQAASFSAQRVGFRGGYWNCGGALA